MCWKKFLQQLDTGNNVDFFYKWLAVELAPTIYGEKPGTLLNLMDTSKLPMKKLWLEHGDELLHNSNIEWVVLKEEPASLKIFFYHADLLNKYVNDNSNRSFLEKFGYHASMNLQEMLLYFKERFQYICPHEMGILLGIPLKDVMGFMGLSGESPTCGGMWKIYGDPKLSLYRMERMEAAKSQVSNWMMQGYQVKDVLGGSECA